MLVLRTLFFLASQALFAAILAASGAPNPWKASAAWWPISATLTNLVSLGLLLFLARREGIRWSRVVHADFRREHVRNDLLLLLGLLVLSGPIAMIPNIGLAKLLYGDAEIAIGLFIQPLPAWAAAASLILFPLSQAVGELPTYFGYAMPRLTIRWGNPRIAMVVCAMWLGMQHVTLPLIPDVRFILWRLGMFIPFALLLAWAFQIRPRLLPYFMGVHAIIDFPVALMVWQASVR